MQGALTADKGFENLKTDLKSKSATFTCKSRDDIKKKLEEIASSNKHVAGFELQ